MDRGTDPMEQEDDSSNNHNTPQSDARTRRSCHSCESQRSTAPLTGPSTSRARFSSGTDETSASHSSTNFLTPLQPPSESGESGSSRPFLTPDEISPNGTANSFLRGDRSPASTRRNPRFDITLPSFSSFRTRSSSVPSPNSAGADSLSTFTPSLANISMTRAHFSHASLSQEPIGLGRPRSESQSSTSNLNESAQNNTGESNQTEGSTTRPPPLSLRQRLRRLMYTLRNRRSTEVNSSVDSEFEEPEGIPEPRQASQSDTEEHQSAFSTTYNPSTGTFNLSPRPSRNSTGIWIFWLLYYKCTKGIFQLLF